MLFVLLTGGEPFLYKGFRQVYEGLKKMGMFISINTNGTMIDEETVAWLRKDPPSRINMTLYGGSNETYNRRCRNPHGFDQTIRAARRLVEAGIPLHFNGSMTPYNIDDLDAIYATARGLGVGIRASSYMFPPMRRDESMVGCGDRFSAEEAGRYAVRLDQLRLKEEEFRERAVAMRQNKRLHGDEEDAAQTDFREPLRCHAGRGSFWINWRGEMTPCGMMTQPLTYPFRDGFLPAWEELGRMTQELYMPPKCTTCDKREVCAVCGASSFTETGTYGVVPQYICDMTESIIRHTEAALQRMEKSET